MSKNRISMTITADQAQAARAGVAQTRAALPQLIELHPDESGLLYMGPQSEAFVRATLRVLRENPQLVPPGLNLAEAEADLAAWDALRPIADQVLALSNQLQDNLTALGSDAMDVALDGYAQIKLMGDRYGLGDLRKEIGARWRRRSRTSGGAVTGTEPVGAGG